MPNTVEPTAGRHLAYDELTPDDSKDFAKLYAIYADLFPLPDEREPPDAFYEIAALNVRADIQMRMGPWRELVSAIRLWQGGPLVGGHVFGVTTSAAHERFGCRASVQAIYTFLLREARGRGQIPHMKAYMCAEALAKFGFEPSPGAMPPLVFLEVNNPKRMTAAEIAEDTARSGLDPHRRYVFWRRNGFAPLKFKYVQPALRADAEPVRYLDLFCTAGVAASIPADVVRAHLSAFVSISVLKGRPAMEDAEFARMAAALLPGTTIPFVAATDPEQRAIFDGARAAARPPVTAPA